MNRRTGGPVRLVRGGAVLLSVVLALMVSTPATSRASPPRTATQAATFAGFDGKSLFRGMVFCQGELVHLFPDLCDNPQIWDTVRTIPGLAQVEERLLERIEALDAEFFHHFSAQLQSGDHLRIQAVLDEAAAVLLSAIADEAGTDESFLSMAARGLVAGQNGEPHLEGGDGDRDLAQGEARIIAVAIAIAAWVATDYTDPALAVAVLLVLWWPRIAPGSMLEREMLIHQIAEMLRVAP